jgi:para-aminobenzoate synthetase/4-amino-4-deoxychorismate lyase
VFETLLARDGTPVALGLHLARLGASVGALYGRPLPGGLAGRIAAAAAGDPGAGRLRVSARPGPGRQLELAIVATRLPAERPAVRLRTATVPGGLGAHKWCDRRLVDALAEALAPDQPLLCDADGRLLETGRANLFAVSPDGALCTPPVAGRLLPGVTRARVIAAARDLGLEVRVAELTPTDLRRAREVFVTGALGGVEPVDACDSSELDGGAREVTARLGSALAASAPTGSPGSPGGRGQVGRGSARFSKIAITLRDRFSE